MTGRQWRLRAFGVRQIMKIMASYDDPVFSSTMMCFVLVLHVAFLDANDGSVDTKGTHTACAAGHDHRL